MSEKLGKIEWLRTRLGYLLLVLAAFISVYEISSTSDSESINAEIIAIGFIASLASFLLLFGPEIIFLENCKKKD